ncbi:hypothetical protein HOLleu_02259 [Holothuria leucospilota]|uniref:Uncharacterized protein n=1 Tax=Holothuria leucospilota TaxID=206669 RepID=A0A9Q1CRI3_HOLLE|nr:hypothetical protein HOLleu_02259 [Holothuria leucospilota]
MHILPLVSRLVTVEVDHNFPSSVYPLYQDYEFEGEWLYRFKQRLLIRVFEVQSKFGTDCFVCGFCLVQMTADRSKQMDRWVEHYSELYSTENTVSEEAIYSILSLPSLDELDTEPTIAELEKTVNGLANGKALGNDGIPPEIIKKGK